MIVREGRTMGANHFEVSVVSSSHTYRQNISSNAFNQLVWFPHECARLYLESNNSSLRSIGFYDGNRHLKNGPIDFKLPNIAHS